MDKKRNNHYVPIWYQKGFTSNGSMIQHLDLEDEIKQHPTNKKNIIIESKPKNKSVKKVFCIQDLYTIFFGEIIIDEIEDKFFGNIDKKGSLAVKALIDNNKDQIHKRFLDFYEFINLQKLRTVKGLEWIKQNYNDIEQNDLLVEMQALSMLNVSIWTNSVREIVSAKDSDVKFIFSDHPVTTYNYSISLDDKDCLYPYDPTITLKATQTIFPLNMDECLILTNYEYADSPDTDPIEKITNPSFYKTGHVHTLNMIRERNLIEEDVIKINYIIKRRAKKYVAGNKKEWLYPENHVDKEWREFKSLLLPPKSKIHIFGGEMIIGYDSGATEYQDAFGRTSPKREYLYKSIDEKDINPNDNCGCGSAKKYKDCCRGKSKEKRTSWKELSIRERNIIFCHGMIDILGMNDGKVWDDIRKELSPIQVKNIFQLFDDLWPLDTDIIRLLPKEDNTLRVLHNGIVDADLVENLVLSMTLYFDEVIVQNPITHPSIMKKEFSPIFAPEKYLQHSLSYIYFMIRILPFIENGTINLIPDPSMFNQHLSLSSLRMSEQRYLKDKPNIDTDKFTKEYVFNEHKRSLMSFSKEEAIGMFRKENVTGISEEELYDSYKQLALNDPKVLLQEDLFKKNGGQMHLLNFVPTFEMTMFISQLTGAIPITYSSTRWKEFLDFQHKELGLPTYSYQKLTNFINGFTFTMSQDTLFVYESRNSKTLKRSRELFSELNNYITSIGTNKRFIKKFKSKFISNNKKYIEEFKDKDEYMYEAKLLFLIPDKGFINNNVRRLLVQNTSDKCSMNIPMAIFISI